MLLTCKISVKMFKIFLHVATACFIHICTTSELQNVLYLPSAFGQA